MRKFLSATSILLVLLTVVAMVPFTLATSATVAAPTTGPDGAEMVLTSITDGTMTAPGTNVAISKRATEFDGTTKTVFDNGNTINPTKCQGMLFRVDSTLNKVQWYFVFEFSDGTANQTVKGNSVKYNWWNGESWAEYTAGSTSYEAKSASGYAYVSFSVLGIASENVSNIKIYSPKSTSRAGTFSEWSLVQTKAQAESNPLIPAPAEPEIPDQIITGASVSLTDDLALNVSVAEIEGCTDAKLTFTFNGITSEATLKDGKYSLEGILPQQISEPVTATWSGTVNGETLTDTVTTSVADYCKTVLATESLADWHELAKALLHYGAAAEAKTGYTDTLSNAGIAAVTNPVDLSAITATAVNNDSQVWKGATLRLDGAIALKIRLNAPEGVTTVTATVDGRANAVTLNIVDGYVTLALNAYELSKNVTFSYGDDAKTLVISADYVLKNTTDTGYSALAQAVANYGKEAGARKNPA